VLLAVVLARTGTRLPIAQFFAASSLLVAVLAIVLQGKGIAGLQEAGLLAVNTVAFPRIGVLGTCPSWQTLAAQAGIKPAHTPRDRDLRGAAEDAVQMPSTEQLRH
jgi:high-affinity iron transporter